MNQATLGSLSVIAAALLWSLDGLLRQQLYSLPPTVVVFWEHVVGLLILSPLFFVSFKAFRQLTRKQWYAIILVSFLSGALGTVLYTAALGKIQYIEFSVVVLLQQLNPLFAIAAAALLLKEPLTRKFLGLAALALIGAYLVSFPDMTVNLAIPNRTIAALMALGAAASWGTSTAFSKYSLRGTSFLHVTAARFAITPIFALLFTLFLGQQGNLGALSQPQWLYVLAITFTTGLVALAIYYFGLQRVPASRSALLELVWPLSSVLVGFLFLGDRLTLTQWLGTVLLLTSMILVTRDIRAFEARKLSQNA